MTMVSGTMEVARDGTVISETHTGAPEPQRTGGTEWPELAERGKYLLENLRARIADSEEDKAKYEPFITSFETYLKTPPEQKKVRGAGILSEMLFYSLQAKGSLDHEFLEKFKELLGGEDEFKKVKSEIS